MRRLGLVALPIAFVVGVLLIVAAHDLRSWRDTMANDVLRRASTPTAQVKLTAPTLLPPAASGDLLSVKRDQQWLRALLAFKTAYDTTLGLDALGPPSYKRLNAGEAALVPLTQDPDPTRASQAYDLLAVLVFREAYPGSGEDPALIREALGDLQNAVLLDAGNEAAKGNLELSLRVLVATQTLRRGRSPGNQANHVQQGGYGGPPGQGY